jgi:hypothetical protein
MKALSLGKIVEVVSAKHPYAKTWEPELLAGWVAAFMREELIICASENGRDIEGIAMFRLVMNAEDAVVDDYHFDPEGACIFLDFLCGETPEMRLGLGIAVIERIGKRPQIAWERRGILRVYRTERVVEHLLKKIRSIKM